MSTLNRRFSHSMTRGIVIGAAVFTCTLGLPAATELFAAPANAVAPKIPAKVDGKAGVKTYLLSVVADVQNAVKDFKTAADAYAKLVAANGNDAAAAAKAQPAEVAKLITQLRDAYQRIDSYGYEYVEGIVAGVPSLSKYDQLLDAGIPASKTAAPDKVADVKITSADHSVDREGSLNNFLIEPTVFGTRDTFTKGSATLPGFDKPVNLPKPAWTVALADFAVKHYDELAKDANAWKPTDQDCFTACANMTPTLADYFEDWKETKKNGSAEGGRFVAVSRVSDMRGIMSSTRLTWLGLEAEVAKKDPALAKAITEGYAKVISFIDDIDKREKTSPLKPEAIDSLGSQAREIADKLTVQVTQAAALLNIDVNAK